MDWIFPYIYIYHFNRPWCWRIVFVQEICIQRSIYLKTVSLFESTLWYTHFFTDLIAKMANMAMGRYDLPSTKIDCSTLKLTSYLWVHCFPDCYGPVSTHNN